MAYPVIYIKNFQARQLFQFFAFYFTGQYTFPEFIYRKHVQHENEAILNKL